MANIQQNTLYLLTPGSYIGRDHLTLGVEVPVYPPDLPPEQRSRETATDIRKLSIPIHHLESICVFGPSTVSPPALGLCWEHGVSVNFLSLSGFCMSIGPIARRWLSISWRNSGRGWRTDWPSPL